MVILFFSYKFVAQDTSILLLQVLHCGVTWRNNDLWHLHSTQPYQAWPLLLAQLPDFHQRSLWPVPNCLLSVFAIYLHTLFIHFGHFEFFIQTVISSSSSQRSKKRKTNVELAFQEDMKSMFAPVSYPAGRIGLERSYYFQLTLKNV